MTAGKTIATSKYFDYVVYDSGEVTKISVGEYQRELPLNQFEDSGGIYVWIGKNKHYIKSLVVRNFMEDVYWRGCVVEHIDGNIENCAVSNLRCVKRDTSSDNSVYTKVLVDGIEFDSIAAAERALFVSHGYLSKYFKGQVAGQAIKGHDVRLAENDEQR